MPVINPNNTSTQRSTFRPPWVKDGPSPLPMPTAPWVGRSNQNNQEDNPGAAEKKPQKPILKKQTKITIPIEAHSENKSNFENGRYNQAQLQPQTQEKVVPIRIESSTSSRRTDEGQPLRNKQLDNQSNPQQPVWRRERPQQLQQSNQIPVTNTSQQAMQNVPPPPPPAPIIQAPKPPAPPMPPMPPPPPPPPGNQQQQESFVKKPLTKEKAQKLEALRSRPRRRPDWSDMMKEVEEGRKLKHVQCNDRSAPVIPNMKAKGQFVYESEQKKPDDTHNKLLKQIQSGIRLKKVKCNDRSKPNLDGLRKFRRQMTTEDLIQKSVSMADVVAAAVEPDELDDIDKVRDDLQSAKQMLALELRNKEAMERENKRLMARLTNLEVELEKEKAARNSQTSKGHPIRTDEDEKLISKLKEEASEADKIAKDIEQKYHTTAEELDNTRRKLESAWLLNQQLEMQLKQIAAQGTPLPQLMKQQSMKKLVPSVANGGSIDLISDDEEEESETESEEDSDEDTSSAAAAATQERQIVKELRLLTTKLRTYREKQAAAMKERKILKEHLTKQQKELKEEKKKYKVLQKEVDKMARLMRDSDDEDEPADDDDELQEDETETESESEESEEEESDTELPLNATAEDKRKNYLERIKKHENRLSSLKKGNYLMKANIERLQDDVNKQREMSLALQEDLNNILADLG